MSRSNELTDAELLEELHLLGAIQGLIVSVLCGSAAFRTLFSDGSPYFAFFDVTMMALVPGVIVFSVWIALKFRKLNHPTLSIFLFGRNWSSFDDTYTQYATDRALFVSWLITITTIGPLWVLQIFSPLPADFYIPFIAAVMLFSAGGSFILLLRKAKIEEPVEIE